MSQIKFENITPYEIYRALTVKDSIKAPHIKNISELLVETVVDDTKPDRLTVSQPPSYRKIKFNNIILSILVNIGESCVKYINC